MPARRSDAGVARGERKEGTVEGLRVGIRVRVGKRRDYARLCFSPSFRIAVVRMTANPPQTKPVMTIIVNIALPDTVAPLLR